ncbi:MAG: ribose 5-phosphate isomerase B [Phaeodactylibacter sp.]|nr:ribose 5-phosphate isomerase B [Phaeodactylibacter sp.]
MKKTIAIGCDHAGYPYKKSVVSLLRSKGIEVLDFGTDSAESVDYPDFAHPVAEEVESGKTPMGVVMCGSGNGIAMTVNKHPGVRAAICWNEELARLARQHNDANILSIPVRFVSEETALAMVEAFLETDFEGGRHARRVEKIAIKK